MAKRPNLSAVKLTGTPLPEPPSRNSKAQTLRLPPDYWGRLRIGAAIQDTSQIAIVQKALDEFFARNPLPPGLGL